MLPSAPLPGKDTLPERRGDIVSNRSAPQQFSARRGRPMTEVWLDLASLAVKAGSGTLGPEDIATIARLVVLANSREKSALAAIGQDIRALVEGPFNAAMLHLEDAQRPGRSEPERRESFQKCRDCLYQAHSHEATRSYRQVIISYYIAACWIASGDASAATTWFSRAYDSLITYAGESRQYIKAAYLSPTVFVSPFPVSVYRYYTRKAKIRGEAKAARFAEIVTALEKLRTTRPDSMHTASPSAEQLESIRWLAELARL
jgi:hypothetical protein